MEQPRAAPQPAEQRHEGDVVDDAPQDHVSEKAVEQSGRESRKAEQRRSELISSPDREGRRTTSTRASMPFSRISMTFSKK